MATLRRIDDKFLAEMDDVDRWLGTRGFKEHKRFRTYKSKLGWLRKHSSPADQSRIYRRLEAEGTLAEILWTMVDSLELVEGISALRRHGVEIPGEILRRALSGPLDALAEEQGSDAARSAMFELTIAAAAARQGLRPLLCPDTPQVLFRFEGRIIQVFCRQVNGAEAGCQVIAESMEELERSAERRVTSFGMVALSVSGLLSRAHAYLAAADPTKALSTCLASSLREHEGRLRRSARPCAKGLLFYLSSPALVPRFGFTRGKHCALFPLDLAELPFLKSFAHVLKI